MNFTPFTIWTFACDQDLSLFYFSCSHEQIMLLLAFFLLFRQSICYINATGVFSGQDPGTKQWPMRQEITSFASSKEMWDLYVQALLEFQDSDPENPTSFYQIAGIHGYPRAPWDNVGGSGNAGFCMHNSVLFPIWHRPYLALYEVCVIGPLRLPLIVLAKSFELHTKNRKTL